MPSKTMLPERRSAQQRRAGGAFARAGFAHKPKRRPGRRAKLTSFCGYMIVIDHATRNACGSGNYTDSPQRQQRQRSQRWRKPGRQRFAIEQALCIRVLRRAQQGGDARFCSTQRLFCITATVSASFFTMPRLCVMNNRLMFSSIEARSSCRICACTVTSSAQGVHRQSAVRGACEQGHCDHHAPALAAGKLVREISSAVSPHDEIPVRLKAVQTPRCPLRIPDEGTALIELFFQRMQRVELTPSAPENHGDVIATNAAQALLVSVQQRLSMEQNIPRG